MYSRMGLNERIANRLHHDTIHPVTGLFLLCLNLLSVRASDSQELLFLFALSVLTCGSYLILYFERVARLRDIAQFSMQDTIDHVHHMIQHILHAYVEQHHLEYRLEQAHASLSRFHEEQEQLIAATQSEVNVQYQQILAYAHYLERCISHRKADTGLREDYDEVCEQAFNLQLIVQAMGMLPVQSALPDLSKVALSDRMASILLDLAPSLDRRAMKLTTAEWDESVQVTSSSEWLTHLLWMVLLGCIRFAEQESTLSLSCKREGTQVRLDVLVSCLSPGTLSETERYRYLERRMQEGEDSAHMFASTLEIHANIRLAKLLTARLMAQLQITPVNSHSCVVQLVLPAAQ